MQKLLKWIFIGVVSLNFAQQSSVVGFKKTSINVSFQPENKLVFGKVIHQFQCLKSIDSVYFDAQNTTFKSVLINGNKATYNYVENKLWLKHKFDKKTIYKVEINYETYPAKAMYFIDWNFEDGNKQIWTQGQGKKSSYWVPVVDDMNAKSVFDITVNFNSDYQVIANGKLINKTAQKDITTWQYAMQQPMSSYLLAIVVGKYVKKEFVSKSKISNELYFYPSDSLKFKSTYAHSETIFNFLEAEIGVPYPWQNYKQVPVKDFFYAGMENTSLTIFSDEYVLDDVGSFDQSYVEVNAHELVHQWFGDLVTETSGTHHWLQEGFATYYALLAQRHIFGDSFYYWKLYAYFQDLKNQDQQGQSTALLNPKSSSITFYEKGAWALHVLREKVGDNAFKKGIKKYLETYKYKNVNTSDFILCMAQSSGMNLSEFVKTWLESSALQWDEMQQILYQSESIKAFDTLDCEVNPSLCEAYLKSGTSDDILIKIMNKYPQEITQETFKNSLRVRQEIARTLTKIPENLKLSYETLLNDKSYKTQEYALYNLWLNFPNERINYLTKTKKIEGLNNKNLRILWLSLALATPNFETGQKEYYLKELTNYTSNKYAFYVREIAFGYLQLLNACYDECEANLNDAQHHFNWQFSKYAKNMLQQLHLN